MNQPKLLDFIAAVVRLRSVGAWATALDIQQEINRGATDRTKVWYGHKPPIESVDWVPVAALCGRRLRPVPATNMEGYYLLDEILG